MSDLAVRQSPDLSAAAGLRYDFGGSGPTREKNARGSAGAFDALLGRKLLCSEVPK
jgi:hypothetical protein